MMEINISHILDYNIWSRIVNFFPKEINDESVAYLTRRLYI
jgi:hypothetical protein